MNTEAISDKQGIALIILFIVGESSILVIGLDAEKDLFEIIELRFGRVFGKVLILL